MPAATRTRRTVITGQNGPLWNATGNAASPAEGSDAKRVVESECHRRGRRVVRPSWPSALADTFNHPLREVTAAGA